MNRTIPLSVPEDLLEEIQETARIAHLSVQDVFRQSTKIAKPTLRASGPVQPPRRLSAWDALPHRGKGELKITRIEGKVKKVVL